MPSPFSFALEIVFFFSSLGKFLLFVFSEDNIKSTLSIDLLSIEIISIVLNDCVGSCAIEF